MVVSKLLGQNHVILPKVVIFFGFPKERGSWHLLWGPHGRATGCRHLPKVATEEATRNQNLLRASFTYYRGMCGCTG